MERPSDERFATTRDAREDLPRGVARVAPRRRRRTVAAAVAVVVVVRGRPRVRDRRRPRRRRSRHRDARRERAIRSAARRESGRRVARAPAGHDRADAGVALRPPPGHRARGLRASEPVQRRAGVLHRRGVGRVRRRAARGAAVDRVRLRARVGGDGVVTVRHVYQPRDLIGRLASSFSTCRFVGEHRASTSSPRQHRPTPTRPPRRRQVLLARAAHPASTRESRGEGRVAAAPRVPVGAVVPPRVARYSLGVRAAAARGRGRRRGRELVASVGAGVHGDSIRRRLEARSYLHRSPYDRVGVVNAIS
eukprot:30720-Pelagococcus_subviridis.AAC.5